jgi:hypothetical protein
MIWSGLHGNMQQGLTIIGFAWYYQMEPQQEIAMKISLEVVERFHEKWILNKSNGCWEWKASLAGKGYGQIKIPGTRKQEYAHRLSYQIHCGSIPKGLFVLHSCDNPKCVRPSHLFLGPQKDNMQDMKKKDRHLYGVKNSVSKLTDEKVRRIHLLYRDGVSQGRLAKIFGIAQGTVWKILKGQRWVHIFREIYPESELAKRS